MEEDQGDQELHKRVKRDLNDNVALASGSGSLEHTMNHSDSVNESGKKTLGSYYLKTAIRMLRDYISDLKTSHISIDDSIRVRMRIEEYEALLNELEARKQQEPDMTLLSTQDRVKLIPMLLDYQAVLLSEALELSDPDVQAQPPVLEDMSELRTKEANGVPVFLSDTVFLEGEYMEPLSAALDSCDKQVHEFVNLLPSVRIFKLLCTHVVDTLSPAAQLNFERYRNILVLLQNQDQLEGGEIPSNLRNSVSFCFESLVGLARRFQLVVDLLQKCGSPEWYKSALELADVRPVSKQTKRWSEFSLAIRNCEWSMDLVELAFHALEKLLTEGTYTVKDASFKWSEEKSRMVLQVPSKSQRPNSTRESVLLEVSRKLEEKDLTALTQELRKLVESEKAKKRFYQGFSNAHEIANYLSKKLTGPIPGIGTYLPYSFSTIDPSNLKFVEYLDRGSAGMVAIYEWDEIRVAVKSVRCHDMSRTKFEQEAAVLGMVQHPNVVRLIGSGFIEKFNTGLLVMELMDHDLRTIIEARIRVLPEGYWPSHVLSPGAQDPAPRPQSQEHTRQSLQAPGGVRFCQHKLNGTSSVGGVAPHTRKLCGEAGRLWTGKVSNPIFVCDHSYGWHHWVESS